MLYYVYASFYRDIMVYVGKGKGSRLKHTLNGESANKILNEFYFRNLYLNDFPLETRKLQHFKYEKEALDYEKALILKNQPIGNRDNSLWIESGMTMYLTKKLRKVLGNNTLDSKLITSRYNEDLIYAPFGLPCKLNCKELPDFLTICENGNVRLSDNILENFPNKSSKFLFSDVKINPDVFNTKTFFEVFNDLKDCGKFLQSTVLTASWVKENDEYMKIIPNPLSKVDKKVVEDLGIDYSSMRQIKWKDNLRLALIRKGFPDDFEEAFGYIQLSEYKGYYFTRKELVGVKSLTLLDIDKMDLSKYKKDRVAF